MSTSFYAAGVSDKEGIYVIIDRSSARGTYVHVRCLCTDLFIDVNKIVISPVVFYECKIWFLIVR